VFATTAKKVATAAAAAATGEAAAAGGTQTHTQIGDVKLEAVAGQVDRHLPSMREMI